MIEVHCDKCKRELDKPGGLAFSPMREDSSTYKYHICVKCWKLFVYWIQGGDEV